MGSHVGAIGIDPSVDLGDALNLMARAATLLGESNDGTASIYAYDDPSGSRVTVTAEQGRIVCMVPTMRPGSVHDVTVAELVEGSECAYERPLLVEVLDGAGDPLYPLAVTIEDLGISAPYIVAGQRACLELVALADMLDVFSDEAAYYAATSAVEDTYQLGAESLIPSGTFAVDGGNPNSEITSTIVMSGVVRWAALRRHTLFDYPFVEMRVATYGGEYAVAVDIADLGGTDSPLVPHAGNVVSGHFYMSGRLLPGAP